MNIAILFSGRIIGFQRSLPLYEKHIFKNNNVHIFIAQNSYNKEELDSIKKHHSNIHIISELYLIPDDYKNVYSHPNADPNGYYFLSMWYNRNKAYEMMKTYSIDNNIHFDCVISARLDLLIDSCELTNIEEGVLYVPHEYHYGGLNDQIAFGTMNTMNIYCSLYNNVLNIKKPDINGPERILNAYIHTTGLSIKHIPVNYNLLNGRHIHNKDRRF